ncbi:SIMPL domain-containing protein [Streptomyces sp. SBST2-5]|uniref:SIMPL domain-containing protein n=1 Tax=Streptomyces composti TaxID=2720025 RepID=A0ABX1A6Q2_9ACTN|nr:SIMPL domain-containing protein [Streptomyces composti]NJP49543.1 SIMPL domain-containing protein [Streptomyces composti]
MTATPYGTPETPHLTVRGEADLDVAPETAGIGITLTARGRDRRGVLDDLTRRNAEVLELVKSYGEAVEHLETGSLTVAPELTRHGRGERVRTYHGTVRLTADLGDFAALGELVTRLFDLELTRVDGPWWALRPGSPAHTEARRRAVHDAVRRARAYAEALGTSLAALIELSDTGAELPRPPAFAARGMEPAAFAGEAAPPPLDLEPQRQHLHAEVTARFTMRPPEL